MYIIQYVLIGNIGMGHGVTFDDVVEIKHDDCSCPFI